MDSDFVATRFDHQTLPVSVYVNLSGKNCRFGLGKFKYSIDGDALAVTEGELLMMSILVAPEGWREVERVCSFCTPTPTEDEREAMTTFVYESGWLTHDQSGELVLKPAKEVRMYEPRRESKGKTPDGKAVMIYETALQSWHGTIDGETAEIFTGMPINGTEWNARQAENQARQWFMKQVGHRGCSSCGCVFFAPDHDGGFSHCENHAGLPLVDD